eukprot:6190932-Pleurochrysis_carterae.AAC.4
MEHSCALSRAHGRALVMADDRGPTTQTEAEQELEPEGVGVEVMSMLYKSHVCGNCWLAEHIGTSCAQATAVVFQQEDACSSSFFACKTTCRALAFSVALSDATGTRCRISSWEYAALLRSR